MPADPDWAGGYPHADVMCGNLSHFLTKVKKTL